MFRKGTLKHPYDCVCCCGSPAKIDVYRNRVSRVSRHTQSKAVQYPAGAVPRTATSL